MSEYEILSLMTAFLGIVVALLIALNDQRK